MAMLYKPHRLKSGNWRICGTSDEDVEVFVELCDCNDHKTPEEARACKHATARLKEIFPDGVMMQGVAEVKVTLDVIAARTAHEVNKAYCEAIGDNSQPHWCEAEAWQKESALAGVAEYLKDPEVTPAQLHSLWMAHKKADGWVYGEDKDAEKKEHPCMVSYLELPAAQRVKDLLFRACVRGVLDRRV